MVNWFPGHMAKAFRHLSKTIKVIDIGLIILDSRIIKTSLSKDIISLLKDKPKLFLFNKCDISDKEILNNWEKHFQKLDYPYLKINANLGKGTNKIIPKIEEILKEEIKKANEKGITLKPYKIAILGIPNSGKSSLVNKLIGKKAKEVKNKPGTTKEISWTSLGGSLVMLDTPGLLWPRLSEKESLNLAFTGAIPDSNLDLLNICYKLIDFLKDNYPNKLKKAYNLTNISKDSLDVINDIGTKKGKLLKGGITDLEQTAILILKDLRMGKIGEISFEMP